MIVYIFHLCVHVFCQSSEIPRSRLQNCFYFNDLFDTLEKKGFFSCPLKLLSSRFSLHFRYLNILFFFFFVRNNLYACNQISQKLDKITNGFLSTSFLKAQKYGHNEHGLSLWSEKNKRTFRTGRFALPNRVGGVQKQKHFHFSFSFIFVCYKTAFCFGFSDAAACCVSGRVFRQYGRAGFAHINPVKHKSVREPPNRNRNPHKP